MNGRLRVALIAHDGQKQDMVEWAVWNRALVASTPQPFHAGPAEGSASFEFAAHWFGIDFQSGQGGE